MRYWTAAALLLISVFAFGFFAKVQAGDNSLEVASDSNYSTQTTNFSAGQTIYVRVTANNEGTDKHQLNLRDNQYNLITSYNLSKNGSKFTASFPTPSSEGYYSLEARIESSGSVSTSVKTIKVGKPQNSNVKVSVSESTSGTSQSPQAEVAGSEDEDQTEGTSPSPEFSPQTEVFQQVPQESGFWTPVFNLVLKIADFLWPF